MIFFKICKCLLLSYFIKLGLYNEKMIKVLVKNIYDCGRKYSKSSKSIT